MSDLDPGGDVGLTMVTAGVFEHEPTKQEKLEMRKAIKRPSEWLRLLCRDWAVENQGLVDACDAKFIEYKPYLKGMLTSQLLCRLSIPLTHKDPHLETHSPVDFWRILGIVDDFDKSYIIAQVERFCAMYNIRGLPDEGENIFAPDLATQDAASMAAAAAAGISVSPSGGIVGLPPYMDSHTAAAAAAAAAAVTTHDATAMKLTKKQATEVSRAHRMAKDAEKALEQERRQNLKKEQKRLSQERKEQKQREREAVAMRKAQERAAREATREDRRKKKLEIRVQREKFAQEQKELALKRAAELVASNRVPIEITRGAAAAKAAANAALAAGGHQPAPEPIIQPTKKPRSAIVVSTAADLHQIVTHSKNLWAKYNAIAKEHNQKVNWITVAKELGIHVKVREKYARMHSRAEQRGFDWVKNGHFKIKDHPEIFIEPTESEQKAKMPLPPPDSSTTVLIAGTKEVGTVMPTLHEHHHHQHHDGTKSASTSPTMQDDAVAAAARVVDETVVEQHHVMAAAAAAVPASAPSPVMPTEDHTAVAAAAVAATVGLVADPTANLVHHHTHHLPHHPHHPHHEEAFQEIKVQTQTI